MMLLSASVCSWLASPALAASPRPVVALLRVPAQVAPGPPPSVTVRVQEAGPAVSLYVKVDVTDLTSRREVAAVLLGWLRSGRTVVVRWPGSLQLAAGAYHVRVIAHDRRGASLLRTPAAPGVTTLTVAAAPAAASSAVSAEAGVPSPAATAALGAVFPVAGAHNFGGPENRYGAPRAGHVHEGQDVLTAEGTPVVAPLAGTITWVSYQEGGAGYYAVEHTAVGFDFMFAHCEAGSLAVGVGEEVGAGARLCLAGQTGDATAPHLHFEMWVGGWWAPGGHTIDPLPYLEAWEAAGGG